MKTHGRGSRHRCSLMAREAEEKDLQTQLSHVEMGISAIPSDGNCLYSAISHQLTRLKTLPWGLPLGPGQV